MDPQLLVLAAFVVGVAEAQTGNATDAQCPVQIPGYFHHGDCNLLCRPATWMDIFVFYLGGYIAHAGTITTFPGQSVASSLYSILAALLFLGGGVLRGLEVISSRAKIAPHSVRHAFRRSTAARLKSSCP